MQIMKQSIRILSLAIIKTEDAIEIDTSNLTIDEVVSKVLDIVE